MSNKEPEVTTPEESWQERWDRKRRRIESTRRKALAFIVASGVFLATMLTMSFIQKPLIGAVFLIPLLVCTAISCSFSLKAGKLNRLGMADE